MAKTPPWKRRQAQPDLEDLRDDCIAIVINSQMTFKQVHEEGGPTPKTIGRWLYKETKFPQLGTIKALLNACGHDLSVVPQGEIHRFGHDGIKYPKPKRKFRR